MAAVLAEGTTTIYNAACEPYLQQLCKMLNSMGAKITGVGSNMLIIEGVDQLRRLRAQNFTRHDRNWFLDWSCSNDKK
jgi:UDP-N-acetylglucosamine enolpyruvyl transferase